MNKRNDLRAAWQVRCRVIGIALLAIQMNVVALATASEIKRPKGVLAGVASRTTCEKNFFSCLPAESEMPDGCRILSKQDFVLADVPELKTCLGKRLAELPSSLLAKKIAMVKFPSARVKTFVGMVVTCWGEAGKKNAKPVDMMAIMKALENRANICNGETETQRSVYTPMDVALQGHEFSMYIPSVYKKEENRAFERSPEDLQMRKCIDAFVKYSQTFQADFKVAKKTPFELTYYHAPNVRKKWMKKENEVTVVVKDQQTDSKQHIFEAADWSCRHKSQYGMGE